MTRITVPAEIRILPLAFVAIWAFFWIPGGIGVIIRHEATLGFVWPLMWLFGTGWMLCALLWTFTGRDMIELTSATLSHCQQTRLFGRRKEYAVANISNLRVTAHSYIDLYSPRLPPFAAFDRCAVSFDCEKKTYRLVMSVHEDDAKYLVSEMCKRVNSLCR